MEGNFARPSSRQRHIAPLVLAGISAATSIIGGMSAAAKAKKAKEEARLAGLKQEQNALYASANQQAQADAQLLMDYDVEGTEGVQYYKKGGELPSKFAQRTPTDQISVQRNLSTQGGGRMPDLPVSNGGYQTKGGNLVPIGSGVELAVGNKHNNTAVDGVSGIQLSQGGETVAEIEDKEVIADGNTVYSHRLKYTPKKSYADMMVSITKKRNKLEAKQDKSNSKMEKNTIDRTLAGLNMAEETLFKTQELHKEAEGSQVLSTMFAKGGRLPYRDPKPVPKWAQTFYNTQKGGKYNGWGTNGLGDFQHPTDPNVVVSANGNPKYPYNTTTAKPTMVASVLDKSAGMSDGSAELTKGITGAATSVIGALGTNSTDADTTTSTVTKPSSLSADLPGYTGKMPIANDQNYATPSVGKPSVGTGNTADPNNKKGFNIDWNQAGSFAMSLAPRLIDNIANAAQTRNAPALPNLIHATATPLETRVNANPQISNAKRTAATLRRGILNNTSNSNVARNNMVATSLNADRAVNEIVANKENQEMALRNANSQNRQAVSNANAAQDNERIMMEYQRANDLNSQRSANTANLVGDITSSIQQAQVRNQFDADTEANLLDDPMGSKIMLMAKNKEFMNNPKYRKLAFARAKELNNAQFTKYLNDNYTE